MAGTGPTPKSHTVRARQNKASTRAKLIEREDGELVEIPDLPRRTDSDGAEIPWHAMVVAWWDDIWLSPMSDEWHDSDIHGLYRLAVLVDCYWSTDNGTTLLKMAAEIRQSGQPYGLSPLDRRRLEWTIESAKDAQAKGRKRDGQQDVAPPAPKPEPGQDPRVMRIVS